MKNTRLIFKITPSSFQVFLSGLQLQNVSGVPILGIEQLPINRFINRVIKRWVDIGGSIVGSLISAPIIAILGLLIKKEDPGPVLFQQERVGEQNRIFHMIKLRSMVLGADENDHLSQSTQREDPRLLKNWKLYAQVEPGRNSLNSGMF